MASALEQKIQMLDKYIAKAEEIEASKDKTEAYRYEKTILGVYSAEIPGLKDILDMYEWKYDDRPTDYLNDVSLLRAKLQNHKLNIESGLFPSLFSKNEGNVTVTQYTQQNMENTISISLEQTLQHINELPEDQLSSEEKIALAEKLASIFASKDKKTKWEKATSVLKWIAEKGIEVGLATLPYIMHTLQ